MMFYTTITGWLLYYFVHTIKGDFTGLNADQVGGFFSSMLGKPGSMTAWMILAVVLGLLPVAKGLQSGVEKNYKADDDRSSHVDARTRIQQHAARWCWRRSEVLLGS